MIPILRNRIRRLLPLLVALAMLPLAGDADNNIQCCAVATSFATSLFGGGNGDEDFFTVPAGSPNLMILLSNSSSMLDFPQTLPFPGSGLTSATWSASSDNSTALDGIACKALGLAAGCSYGPATSYTNLQTNTAMAASATPPYDNGLASTTTRLVNDAPPWGLPSPSGNGTCTPRTTDGTGTCLFTPGNFYFYRTKTSTDFSGLLGSGGLGDAAASWTTNGAYAFTSVATLCALSRVPNAANCALALATKGYYLFKDQRVGGNNKPAAAFFAGWFLNLYPPKFVVARKIVKSLAVVDTDTPSPTDSLRIGLTVLHAKTAGNGGQKNSLSNTDGGILVVPLGPNCSVYPARAEDMTEPRQAVIDAINNPAQVEFWDGTSGEIMNQLAETLYNIGQYFSSYPASGNIYTKLFGSSWVTTDANWLGSSAGAINASWATESGERQDSFCWSCQQSSVVIVTDGLPKYDNNLPQSGSFATHTGISYSSADGTGDFRKWSNGKIDCPTCGTDAGSGVPNLLHKVASFLNQNDLRNETGMAKLQVLNTYTVTFGITPGSAAETLLQKTAELGGGTYNNASSADELAQALNDAATNVISRATSFSVSSTPSLQTSQNTLLLLARFRPSQSPAWEGHLYRFQIFNEFAQGCDSSKPTSEQVLTTCTTSSNAKVTLNPNLNGDEVGGNAVCNGVFILDGQCDPVVENDNGDFVKATFASTTHQLVAGTTTAVPFWDAGYDLSTPSASGAYRSANESAANKRVIWTVLDTDGDGKLTPADGLTELKTSLSSTSWAKLKAALGVDVNYCTTLFGKMGVLNASSSFDLTTNPSGALDECAKQVVWFIRGWDVLDEDDDGCGGPDFPSNSTATGCAANGEERDRVNDGRDTDRKTFWKLGDIFHSSPVLVNPPANTLVCDLALDNQCVATIHSPQALSGAIQTPMASYTVSGKTVDAYEKYRQDHATRSKVVLVGANDGMLHAFDAGSTDNGTGAELWAFVPPDLLPKLKNALLNHDYFVDGNTMIRDIWVDGSGSEDASPDGTKQADEFHTIAVVSERSGGTEYVALDVTNPTAPAFRWIYPQPCSLDVSMMGQSWTGFAPRPPPIGPIKLAVPTNGAKDPKGRGFEERWIAIVNGGYDASLTRGRGIWMMDAWTGENIWRFTNDDFAANVNSSGGMWPVPGSVSMLDVGAAPQSKIDSDGFFDTATWADIGGQIYVARFGSPDKTTWAAARAFEEQRQATDAQIITNRSEFYFMPANTIDPTTGFLHTYVGSGNRERLLTNGASCGPDNVFGCFQAGCNADVTTSYDYGSCSYQVKAHANNGTILQDRSSTTSTACANTGITCNQVKVDFKVVTVCNGWKPTGGSFEASLVCDASGICTTQQHVQKGNSAPASKLVNPNTHNRFYGIWSFGGAGRTFDDAAGAVTFDANRFTDISYAGTCSGPTANSCQLVNATFATVSSTGAVTCSSGTTCSAGDHDPGWFYEYGHASACPLASGCDTTDWTDEKTGSGATVLASCAIWNTFRPAVAGTSATTPCTSTSGTARNFRYLADFVTGVPTSTCGTATSSGAIARATIRSGVAPPIDPIQMVIVGKQGSVAYSTTQIEPGVPPQSQQVGTGSDTNRMIYWLEVPRPLHACRHTDPTQCD